MHGRNDIIPPPAAIEAEHLDRMHALASRSLLLQRQTWDLGEVAYVMLIGGGALGVALSISAILNGAWLRLLAFGTWTVGCGAFCAVLFRYAWKGMDLIRQQERVLTEWQAEEVRRRLG